MKRWTWLVGAMALLLLVATAVRAAETPAEVKKPEEVQKADEAKKPEAAKKVALEGDLATLAREAKLSEEQQQKLLEAVNAAQAAGEAWQKANAAALEAYKKAMTAAREANDSAAMKKAMDDIRPVIEESRALRTKHEAAIMGILAPEQRIAWQGYLIWMDLTTSLRRVNLTDEQSAKIRPLADAAAKEFNDIKAEGEEAWKAQRAIEEKLITAIKEKVLTPEQREIIEPKPPVEPKPAAEKPAAEKPAAEKPAAEKPATEKPAAEKPAAEVAPPAAK